MCGRYTLKRADRVREENARAFNVTLEFTNRFNVSPSQTLPVVALDSDGRPRPAMMKWGLIPFWDKSEKPKIAPINARAEDVLSKPMFKQSLQKRRCLVPADGFFEWKRIDETTKIPYHIQIKNAQPFWFAGIHEFGSDTRPESYAMLTTTPNSLMEGIHNRMPVILTEETAKKWITPGELDASGLRDFVQPFAADQMEAFSVARIVNNPRNDSPECVVPAALLTHEELSGPNSA